MYFVQNAVIQSEQELILVSLRKSRNAKMNSEHIDSLTNYNYITSKVTKSRIDKGLLAIPKSLADKYFPNNDSTIRICFDESKHFETKNYMCFTSSSREARIGAMKEWYQSNRTI